MQVEQAEKTEGARQPSETRNDIRPTVLATFTGPRSRR
jgi:hypothetical protein